MPDNSTADDNDLFLQELGWVVIPSSEYGHFTLVYQPHKDAYVPPGDIRNPAMVVINLPYHILKEYRESQGRDPLDNLNAQADQPWIDAINEMALDMALKMDNIQRDLRRKLGLKPDVEYVKTGPLTPVKTPTQLSTFEKAWGNITVTHDGEEEEPRHPASFAGVIVGRHEYNQIRMGWDYFDENGAHLGFIGDQMSFERERDKAEKGPLGTYMGVPIHRSEYNAHEHSTYYYDENDELLGRVDDIHQPKPGPIKTRKKTSTK